MTQTMEQWLEDVDTRLTPPEKDKWLNLAADARRRTTILLQQATATDSSAVPNPMQSGVITDEWIESVFAEQATKGRAQAEIKLLRGVCRDAEGQANHCLPNANDVLREYHRKLKSLLAEVAEIATKLGGVDTAEKAIRADLTTEWKQLDQLAKDYKELRRAQGAKYGMDTQRSAVPTLGGEEHASDLYIKNLDEIWPNWRQPGQGPQITYLADNKVHRPEPWPADPVKLLIWLATSNAQPWIPTVGQLNSLIEERRNKANPNPTKLPGIVDYANKPLKKNGGLGRGTPGPTPIYGTVIPRSAV